VCSKIYEEICSIWLEPINTDANTGIDTLESILGRLSDLKYGEIARSIEIAEASNDFGEQPDYENRLLKSKDLEDEFCVMIHD
jgi:hypothetical protein